MPKKTRDPRGKSQIVRRNVRVGALKTSVSLEAVFWDEIKSIADAQGTPVGQLIATIDTERRDRQHVNLSSAIRLFVLDYYRQRDGQGAVP